MEANVKHCSFAIPLAQTDAWGQDKKNILSPARAQTILCCSPWYPGPVQHHHATFLIMILCFYQNTTQLVAFYKDITIESLPCNNLNSFSTIVSGINHNVKMCNWLYIYDAAKNMRSYYEISYDMEKWSIAICRIFTFRQLNVCGHYSYDLCFITSKH